MIYEFAPQFPKKRERLLCLFFLFLGAVLFASSYIPGVSARWVFQLLAVASFSAMILFLGTYLMRRYVYTVEEKEGEDPDFIITEYYGRSRTVVCRVSLSSVRSCVPYERKKKKELLKTEGKRHLYVYTGVLFDETQYLLRIEAHGEELFLRICADHGLLRFLEGSMES